MPTSITVAPGFTNSRVTKAGRPMAATRMSAVRARPARPTVFEWHTVTVASRCEQQQCHGLPDDVATAEHHGLLALERDALPLEQFDAPERRAGHQGGAALHQQPDVVRMEAVDILRRIDGVEDALLGVLAHARGQRRLDQDGVDGLIRIEPAHERQGFVQGGRVVETKQLGAAPGIADRLDLVANVDFRRGIAPGQHHAQPRRAAVALGERAQCAAQRLRESVRPRPHRPIVAPPSINQHSRDHQLQALSPDAFVKPKPTSQTAIATTRKRGRTRRLLPP